MTQTPSDRLHAFDTLRASMMLLGIVLHAACNYVTFPLPAWPFKDEQTSGVADLIVIAIHVFRMPVFFVMAGFFTGLLVERRGAPGMLRNRMARVALPFGLFWIVVTPLVSVAATFASGAKAGDALGGAWAFLRTGPLWSDNTMHLWFLWYLVLFYLLVVPFAPVAARVPAELKARLSRAFRAIVGSRLRALVLAVPMTGILLLQGGYLLTANSFVPDPRVLAGYLLFFGFGAALWHHRALLPELARGAVPELLVALVLIPVNLGVTVKLTPEAPLQTVLLASATGAVMVWLFNFGILGLVMRWARHERPWLRYLTDASYWMYLVHLPLMFFIPGLLATWVVPAPLKIAVTIVVATPILVASYHWLVRGTWLGVLLNGQRHPVASWVPGPMRPLLPSGQAR